jgi:hypothetical protein
MGEKSLADSANAHAVRAPAVEFWRRALSQIPTVFGRLVYMSSLRDAATGHYSQDALVRILGAEDADRTLCHHHHQIFSQWLSFSLLEQKDDVGCYLSSVRGPRSVIQYRHLVPRTAREVERQLYLTDLETLLELLRLERGAPSETPEA